jgi:hypothetical protein
MNNKIYSDLAIMIILDLAIAITIIDEVRTGFVNGNITVSILIQISFLGYFVYETNKKIKQI